jgi:glycine cleavage system H protein
MSAILSFLTAAILVIIGIFRSKRSTEPTKEVIVRRYVHPGHSWVRETEDGSVLIGIDDFAQNVIGTVESIELPRLLKGVKQGEAAMVLHHGDHSVKMVSPVSGHIIEKNEMVMANPSLVNTATYGDGWLLRVKPSKKVGEMNNLLSGKSLQQWQEAVRVRLHQFFSATPALMYQDGGEFVKDLSDKCSVEEWDKLTKEFFLN